MWTQPLAFGSATSLGTLVFEYLFEDSGTGGPFANTSGRGPGSATIATPDGAAASSSTTAYEGSKSLHLTGPQDGHERIEIPYHVDLNIGTADFDIEIAAYIVQWLTSEYGPNLFSWGGNVPTPSSSTVCPAAGFHIGNGGASTPAGKLRYGNTVPSGITAVDFETSFIPSLNTWYKYRFSRRSGVVEVFVDDVSYGTVADTSSYTNAPRSGVVYAGVSWSTAGNFRDVYLDAFRFWNGNV